MDPLQIESITFSNFKALVNTTLPLGRFTLIVGPNGSGKSTALQAISFLRRQQSDQGEFPWLRSAGMIHNNGALPVLEVGWRGTPDASRSLLRWRPDASLRIEHTVQNPIAKQINSFLDEMRVYSLDPTVIWKAVGLVPRAELNPNGSGLAVVLDRLRDEAPEQFCELNKEVERWLPEFDHILFETPQGGTRSIRLRTSIDGHSIPAEQLSHGTLLALAMLTLAYLPNPPSLIGLEEPDRGIHPRLLRDVRDALYRLAYPEQFDESRPPVQVIATTQSPYFLDLFSEHPEEIVIAEKHGLEAEFKPLTEHGHIEEILAGASLGDIWYSGILGGVPSQP